ncbi:MAG: alginate lyase family protein, partial [Chloroflexota bacterium]
LYNEQLETLRAVDSDLSLLEEIWRTAMKLAGGVVLERSDVFVLGVEDFRHIVRTHIHPEGYLPLIVENQPGNALEMQVFAAKGLVLGAEAATHAGSDLWSYESRGISAKTAAIYAAAYYEYPDTWKWDEPPTPEVTEALYQQNAGFFEMLNRKLDPVVLDATMDKLRPVFDPYGGGLTTLSHGVPKRRGLFGFLGG